MTSRKFYRRVIQFEILGEEPDIKTLDSLETIGYATTYGECSGQFLQDSVNEEIDGKKAAELLQGQGSDPSFFQLDDDGNDLEEEK